MLILDEVNVAAIVGELADERRKVAQIRCPAILSSAGVKGGVTARIVNKNLNHAFSCGARNAVGSPPVRVNETDGGVANAGVGPRRGRAGVVGFACRASWTNVQMLAGRNNGAARSAAQSGAHEFFAGVAQTKMCQQEGVLERAERKSLGWHGGNSRCSCVGYDNRCRRGG